MLLVARIAAKVKAHNREKLVPGRDPPRLIRYFV
jgi:hypothetical protein